METVAMRGACLLLLMWMATGCSGSVPDPITAIETQGDISTYERPDGLIGFARSDGSLAGPGVWKTPTGFVEFDHGVKHGRELYEAAGMKREAEWKNGRLHGITRITEADPDYYREQRYEQGVAIGPEQSYYRGEPYP